MGMKHVHSNKLRNTILLAGAALTLGVFASTSHAYASDEKTQVITTAPTNNNTKKDTDAANPTPTTPTLDTTYSSAKAAIDATSTRQEADDVASQQIEKETAAISNYYNSQKAAKSVELQQNYNSQSAAYKSAYDQASKAFLDGDPLSVPAISDAYASASKASQKVKDAQQKVNTADAAVTDAQKKVNETSAALSTASSAASEADSEFKKAQGTNDETKAQARLSEATQTKNKAQSAYDEAFRKLNSAKDTLKKAKTALQDAQKKSGGSLASFSVIYLHDLKEQSDQALAKLDPNSEANKQMLDSYDTDSKAEVGRMTEMLKGFVSDHFKTSPAEISNGKANTWGTKSSKDGETSWFYYGKDGKAVQGWHHIDGHWYYFAPSNAEMLTGLQKVNGKTYYFNTNHDGTYGAMKTGWQSINGKWYGFGGPNDGSALTGWHYLNKNWYYFNNDGEARTGFQTINGNRYYFDPTNAWALRGWQSLNNDWYYFDPTNVWALSGWQNLNGWFYFSPESYKSLTGLQTINNHLYYLNDQHDGTFGMMKTGWQSVNGKWYYFSSNGDALSGWQTIGGYHYYLNPTNYQMMTGIQKLGNNYYFFGPSGNQETGLIYNSATGLLQYYDPSTGTRQTSATLNGKTLTFNATTGDLDTTNIANGLVLFGNNRYFFLKNSNRFDTNNWQKINGSWYYFGSNSTATTGWYKSAAGNWYYFNPDGKARTGWQSINGHWYLFDANNANAITGWYWSGYAWYWFDQNNAWMVTNGWGFNQNNGQRYYLDGAGHPMTGWLKSFDGTWYYFQPGSDAALANGRYWIGARQYSFGPTGNWLGY